MQYFFLLIGSVLIIDALVGEKGLLQMMQVRERYATLEESLAEVRAEHREERLPLTGTITARRG